jgi:hypothetical protein
MLVFVRDERVGHFLVGVPAPFVMIPLLLIGLGWLVWFVTARRRLPPGSVRRCSRDDLAWRAKNR